MTSSIDTAEMCNSENISEQKIIEHLSSPCNKPVLVAEGLKYYQNDRTEVNEFKTWADSITTIKSAQQEYLIWKQKSPIKRAVAFGKWLSFVKTLDEIRQLYKKASSTFEESLAIKELSKFYEIAIL